MKTKRFREYLNYGKAKKADPITKSDIQKNPDKHIDQDFEGYPNGPAKEEVINPKTSQQKKTAQVDVKDGEKKTRKTKPSEQDSEGSGGAFAATEEVRD